MVAEFCDERGRAPRGERPHARERAGVRIGPAQPERITERGIGVLGRPGRVDAGERRDDRAGALGIRLRDLPELRLLAHGPQAHGRREGERVLRELGERAPGGRGSRFE